VLTSFLEKAMGFSFFFMGKTIHNPMVSSRLTHETEVLVQARHSQQKGMLCESKTAISSQEFSVAEIAKKPLYRVTCGDIGTKVEEVEDVCPTLS
jgi:hypothetical protein